MEVTRRPGGVGVLATIGVLTGLFEWYLSFDIWPEYVSGAYPLSVTVPLITLYTTSGVLSLALGVMLWVRRRWAWTLGVSCCAYSVVANSLEGLAFPLIFFYVSGPLILWNLIALAYLARPHVRAYFGQASRPAADVGSG